ncbi:hypothetical protein EJ07DRAFT_107465 [Lizonia empirigonia]|nr:hypothetical protein EJ07DRAFT_107465 [Lizonia empirigonia]
MFGLSGQQVPTPPPTVHTDKILPLNAADDTTVLRSVVVVLSYRFDDVLDPEKLKSSYEKLLDRPGWRKIGARLRLNNATGRLEYHIPESYDQKRPIVNWSHVTHNMSIMDHPLASKLPRPTDRPAVVADPHEFDELTISDNAPKTVSEYLVRDVAQTALHVVSFNDSTLISISLPHTLTDGTGGALIYKSWALVLQGREDEVPPFHAYDHDPLEGFGDDPREPYMFKDRLLTGWKKWMFIAYQVYDGWRYKTSSRIVCVPKAFLAEQRRKAIEEIRASTGNDTAFVSDNDVLVAWFTRLCVGIFPRTSPMTVRIMNAFALSSVLAERLPAGKAYISNAATEIYTFWSVRDFFTKPISACAWAIRCSMMEGGRYHQIEALAAEKKECEKREGNSWPQFGVPSMELMSYSNWSKGKYFDTDFSAAMIKQGYPNTKRVEKPGYASMVQFNAWTEGFDLRNLMPIMGKDAAGNYWLQGPLREVVWDSIDKQLKASVGGL